MTYREKFFELKKLDNQYINQTSIKSLLIDNGGFVDFFDLLKHFDEELKDENKLNNQIDRLTSGEPLQYILGYAYFVNSNYKVSPDVLIPRQETEQLAVATMTKIIKLFGKDPKIKIVDIGTGSGILGIYLKEYFSKSTVRRKNESLCHIERRSQMKTHGKSCRMISGSQNNKFSIQLSASQIFNSTQISKYLGSFFALKEFSTLAHHSREKVPFSTPNIDKSSSASNFAFILAAIK